MSLSAHVGAASDGADGAPRRVHVTTIAAHTLEGQLRFVHLLRPAPAEPVETEVAPRPPAHERLPMPTPDPGAYAPVAEAAESSARQRRPALLTQRELEVLRLLGAGHSTDDISRELNITRVTARNHVNKVLDKLGVNSRLQAVVIASQLQLI
jgi:DNA-binding CsgD family transcriptional regulator